MLLILLVAVEGRAREAVSKEPGREEACDLSREIRINCLWARCSVDNLTCSPNFQWAAGVFLRLCATTAAGDTSFRR